MSLLANVDFAGLTIGMVVLLGLGVLRASRRAAEPPRLAIFVVLALSLWLALSAALSLSGALASFAPPRWPLLPLTALLTVLALSRSRAVRTLLENTPVQYVLYAQSFRVLVELGLYALLASGRAPARVTFEGRNFDVVIGLTAPIVAWLISTKRVRLGFVAAWNGIGLVVLANTILTIARATPGPLHAVGEPFPELVEWPIVWLPGFLMPLAVFLHIASLRQTRLSTSVAPR